MAENPFSSIFVCRSENNTIKANTKTHTQRTITQNIIIIIIKSNDYNYRKKKKWMKNYGFSCERSALSVFGGFIVCTKWKIKIIYLYIAKYEINSTIIKF